MPVFRSIFLALFIISSEAQATLIVHSDYLSEPKAFPNQHASTLVELPDGRLLGCWWAGSSEGNPNVKIFCRHWEDTKGWGERSLIADANSPVNGHRNTNAKVGNAALGVDTQGQVWLFNTAVRRPMGGWSMASIDYRVMPKGSDQFAGAKTLIGGPLNLGSMVRSMALPVKPGLMALPIYSDLRNKGGLALISFKDDRVSKVKKIFMSNGDSRQGIIQPYLVRDGQQFWAYMRNKDRKWTKLAKFDIASQSWNKPVDTDIPNSNSPSAAVKLGNSCLLILTNPSSARPRFPLTLMASNDGIHFKKIIELEGPDQKSEFNDYAYPSLIRSSEGTIHATYTFNGRLAIKHVWFSENEITSAIAEAGIKCQEQANASEFIPAS